MDKLLTKEQVCDALAVSRATLYRKIECGQIPRPLKDGRSSKWRESDIQPYIDSLNRGFSPRIRKKDKSESCNT
ncbi:helix-turn-helix domain-containing protein [Xenorhabdus sp. XENO-10]|uniref:Helix-turn-helix domain-containing protein n=1 Tax=Xenorhabdus yunnanensis TaxID=3025878 RepID=A0ABT5LJE2_9GAMM|nr:helix-turn-helix domain-containing protein [Xenorhabdus yunnanensis]MDC9591236.1 helix-turn-helix domain-containing protein [Xenorhabdus yunnanensis]